jgi:NitT/TauT family transport system permease protein
MSDTVIASGAIFRAGTSDAEIEAAAAKAARRRKGIVLFWRWSILLVFLGVWEIGARNGWIDEFFFARPSTIYGRLADWVTEGTSEGPLWYHLGVTME